VQSSSFQCVFIAALAGGLGFSIASGRAESYPAGAAISLGSNPVISAGDIVDAGTNTVFTAPDDHQIVVTDVILSYSNGNCHPQVTLDRTDGTVLAKFRLRQDNDGDKTSEPTSVQHAFQSGLPVPAGESLRITEEGSCDVAYTISGYLAHP
jgi:hypothetical protein